VSGDAPWRLHPFIHPRLFEEDMRAETESVVNEIKESLSLLRRHL
jgi:hypothetical protein